MENSKDVKSDVPPGTRLVQAPYELKRKNSTISHTFLVFKGREVDPMRPDVDLQTKNALLHSAVYANDQDWGGPVSIHAQTKNADLVLEVHTLQLDQCVEVRTSTKNGRNRVFLPRDFQGFLEVSTKNGICTLSEDLRKVAVLLPSVDEKLAADNESFESCGSVDGSDLPASTQLSNGVGVRYEINGGGPSIALVDTKNGNVHVGLVQDEVEDEGFSCWAKCSVM